MKVERLIELNDEGIFVTSDVQVNGDRLIKHIKKHRKKPTVDKNKSTVKKADQLCLKD